MKYNPDFHHRHSIRLKGYDYSQSGIYFVTLCLQDRECLLGKIENGEMVLSDVGRIAYNEWFKTPELRKNIELGEFVVMPNHIHGIIIITDNHRDDTRRGELNSPNKLLDKSSMGEFNSPLRVSPSQTIGSIVRGYKSSVTKKINSLYGQISYVTIWQRNYYEHIIRNEQSYETIANYILNNPAKWTEDKFHN